MDVVFQTGFDLGNPVYQELDIAELSALTAYEGHLKRKG